MIKVLIVDDDQLVRKGLISTIPWEKYEMKVVGEAKNGEKALEFIASNEINLLLTDLAMPVMSGLDLIKIVSERYPSIYQVILTMHQDFEYIQEALRLGVLDYIAKIEMDSFGEVLARVRRKIINEGTRPLHVNDHTTVLSFNKGLVLMTTIENRATEKIKMIQENMMIQPNIQSAGFWLWLPSCEEEMLEIEQCLLRSKPNECILISLEGLRGRSINEIHLLLIKYNEKQFLYDYLPEKNKMIISIQDLEKNHVSDESGITNIKERSLSLKWVMHDKEFEELLRDFKSLHLSTVKVTNLLYYFVNEWKRLYSPIKSVIHFPDSITYWYEVEAWLLQTKVVISHTMGHDLFSNGVQESMIKAIQLIHEELAEQVHASEIAKRVNISRSYFSQCFKDFTGMTFNEYVRHVRIEKAKDYLMHTDKAIAWVAESIGYTDDKYFSRLFRKKTGILPSEYRKQSQGR